MSTWHQATQRACKRLPERSRCEPSGACIVRGKCARYQAAILRGSPLGDYSLETCGGTILCSGYLDSGSVRSAAAPARRVFKPMGSKA